MPKKRRSKRRKRIPHNLRSKKLLARKRRLRGGLAPLVAALAPALIGPVVDGVLGPIMSVFKKL